VRGRLLACALALLVVLSCGLPACFGGVSLGTANGEDAGSPGDGASPDVGFDAGDALDAVASPCATTADCPPLLLCGFLASDGCTATGQCFPMGLQCNNYSPGCACDGTLINAECSGLPTGYTPKPLLHLGVCSIEGDGGGGGMDATSGDGGGVMGDATSVDGSGD
jgi:hypothetical protein